MKQKTKIVYKTKPKTLAKFKKDLRLVLHRYIRQRDCGGTSAGFGMCISCDKPLMFREMEAGHFIPSTYPAVRFDEANINGQCKQCNQWKKGNTIEYRPRLIQKIGKEAVEDLENRRHDTFKQTREWFEERINFYKSKLQEL